MKNAIKTLVGLLFIAVGILILLGNTPRTIESSIIVSTTPDEAWKIVSDFNTWTDWNPTVSQVSGGGALNEKLKIGIRGPDGKEASLFEPVITKLEAPQTLRWETQMGSPLIFSNAREIRLQQTSEGTKIVQIEEFSGMMVPLMWSQLQDFVSQHLEATNQALKSTLDTSSLPENL